MDHTTKPNRRFIGSYRCILDSKHRLFLPTPIRKLIPDELFKELLVFKGRQNCLNLYTSDYFEFIMAELDKLPPSDEKLRLIMYYGDNTKKLSVDGSGRIAIPSDCLERLGNSRQVVLVGVFDYVQIWNPAEYEEAAAESQKTYNRGGGLDWPY